MTIPMAWWLAIFGGALIGLSALLMFGLLGRIAGISGILWQGLKNLFSRGPSFEPWRWAFLIGMPLGGGLIHWWLAIPIPHFNHAPVIIVLLSGFAVGFGTRLGSGCTSGHGICGISRLSPRSLTATGLFMAVAMIVVFFSR